ncbi:hypothetical protein JXR01_03740 [Candidatus Kaiserbacteria bacterium]|nr:MAG: hypothetical protein JXR01_03740 [Candidatus Kaiserbacteria bacterium]
MNKIAPIVIILIALIGIAWYYVSSDTNKAPEPTQTDVVAVTEKMVGEWKSVDDEKSVVVFNANGTTMDIYDGEQLAQGVWEVFETTPQESSGPRLRTTINGEEFDYTIWNVDETELVINYSARGNTLRYTRVVVPAVDTSIWNTYNNEEYLFTLLHPDSWEIQEALKPRELHALHEILIFEDKESLWRASASVFIFPNEEKRTVGQWWNDWLAQEDAKEAECRTEYGEESPCLFLRGIVEWEKDTELGGEEAFTVGLFRFDHEEECTYAAVGDYVYGICAPGLNPNDPQEKEHRAITNGILESFEFN